MQVAGQLFDDVVDDFSELECVRREFEKWKFTYRDTYQEAYIGLCLPKLMNPFIRLQLLKWSPLEVIWSLKINWLRFYFQILVIVLYLCTVIFKILMF